MRERKIFKVVVIFILLFSSMLNARRYYVRESGDDDNDGLTSETAWRTIQRAAGDPTIGAGDTVIIGPGVYPNKFTISQSGRDGEPVTYYGDFEGKFVPDGVGDVYVDNWSNDKYLVELYGREFVRIRGLTLRWGNYGGTRIQDSRGIVIDSCEFVWNNRYGIYCLRSRNIVINGNTVRGGNVAGFGLFECNGEIEISNNVVRECRRGLYLSETEAKYIGDNVLSSCNNSGIYASESKIESIESNQIYNIWSGYGIYLYRTDCGHVRANVIYNCGNSGIYCRSDGKDYEVVGISGNEIHDIWLNHGICIIRQNVERVSSNVIYDIASDGIYIEAGNQYEVSHIDSNLIHNAYGDGLVFFNGQDVESIKGNVIYRARRGIYWKAGKNHSIGDFSGNIIHSNWEGGIKIKKLTNTVIENNLIYGNVYWDCYGIWIESNGNRPLDIKNNTVYKAGYVGIYGKNVKGSWRNNIVYGHHLYGIYGKGNFDMVDSYNCVFGNFYNWGGKAEPGPGSFSDDPLFVDPDGADNILGGDHWEDDDLHVKSIYGSYHAGAWIPDDVHSPCIDAGHPDDDYSMEPEDNGDRINIGCYGNTSEASLSGPTLQEMVYHSFPLNLWVMIGVPLIPVDGDPLLVYGNDFGGEMPDGAWSCIRWTCEDSVSEYYEYGDGTIYQPPDCYPGISHFVWQNTGAPVDVDVQGTELTVPCTLTVAQAPAVDWYPPAPGFNMFANPYPYTIDWSNSYVIKYSENGVGNLTLPEAAAEGYISQYAYLWDHENGDYEIIVPQNTILDTVSVWRGFWFIQLDSVTNLKLVIPNRRVDVRIPPVSPFFCIGKQSGDVRNMRFEGKEVKRLASLSSRFTLKKATISQEWDWFLKLGVKSTDGMLRDYENGIGVNEGSVDGLDAWDAYDFRGMDRYGNFVQLAFVGPEGRPLAYDLRGDFDREKEWEFKVITNRKNLDKDFLLLFPHVRLVPGGIDFRILDRDRGVIVDGLRDKRYMEITLHDSVETFYITAYKKQDNEPPSFSYNVSYGENGTLVGLYVIPSEPVDTVWAEINGEMLGFEELPSVGGIYYSYLDLPEGSYDIKISGIDLNGNEGMEHFSILKVSPTVRAEVKSLSPGMEIHFPQSQERELVISQGNIDVDVPYGFELLSRPLFIGPEDVEFSSPAVLVVKSPDLLRSGRLYRYVDRKWGFVCMVEEENYLPGGGIYCVLGKSGSSEEQEPVNSVREFKLFEPFPNPFNSVTRVRYLLKEAGNVELVIYDLLGKKVKELQRGFETSGYHVVLWDGRDDQGRKMSSGTYFLKIRVVDGNKELFSDDKKLILLK